MASADLQSLAKEAQALSAQGEFVGAAEVYEKILAENPKLAEVYVNQGACYFKAGELPKALTSFEKALAINAQLFSAQFNLGNIYAQMEKYAEAAEAFKKAFQIKADDRIHIALATAYNNAGKFEEAAAAATTGIQTQNGGDVIPLREQRILAFLKLDRPVDAVEDVEEILKLKSWDDLPETNRKLYANILSFKAHALMDEGQLPAALVYLERVNEVEPTAHRLYTQGLCLAQAARVEESVRVLQKSLELDPESQPSMKALGLVYTDLAEYQAGAQLIEAMFAKFGNSKSDVELNSCLGVCLMGLKKHKEAKAPLKYVYDTDKNNWVAAALLGAIYLFEENIPGAVEVLESAIQSSRGKADDSVYYNYGYALLKQSMLEDALVAFETALKLNPHNKSAALAIEEIKAELARVRKEEEAAQEELEKQQAVELEKQQVIEREKKQALEKQQAVEREKQKAAQAGAIELEKQKAAQAGAIGNHERQSGQGGHGPGAVDEYFAKKKPNFTIPDGNGARPRRRMGTRVAALQVKLKPQLAPQAHFKRKSLSVIPSGIAYKGAVKYANWYNEQMKQQIDGADEEGGEQK